jgi:OOP family OmpA-OmpF porin
MVHPIFSARRTLLALAVVVPIWVSGAVQAQAQDVQLRTDVGARRDFRFELGVIGGGHFFNGEHTLGRAEEDPESLSPASAGAFGLTFAVNAGKYVAFEAEGMATRTNTRDFATDMWVFQLGGHMRLHPNLSGPVQPYLMLGYGAIASVVDDKGVEDDDQDGVGRAGLGLRIRLNDRLGLRLEGRVQSSMAFASDWLALGDETGYSGPDFLGLASVFVNLGATRPKLWVEDKVVVKDPDIADDDRDGIANRADRCPKDAEDPDGFEDEDGCPDLDNDGDGIADARDRCPLRAETKNGIDDDDGCPETDEDGDRIVGTHDLCPNEPESYNGFKDGDGCPDALPEDVRRFTGAIAGINFRGSTPTLITSSFALLDRAVEVLKQYPELRIEVTGHTEARGSGEANHQLSQQRAEKVREYLISKGIESSRIVAVGFGQDRPIASNRSASGRAKNRRIEFRVLTADVGTPGTPGKVGTPLTPAVPPAGAAQPTPKS